MLQSSLRYKYGKVLELSRCSLFGIKKIELFILAKIAYSNSYYSFSLEMGKSFLLNSVRFMCIETKIQL